MTEVSGESGFEVARAYVAVSPDASDFAAALDEQVGGISISAVVVPDASDFAAAMDEQVGGLQVTVAVVPDASDFADALDEQIGGLTATVTVLPDVSDLESAIGEQVGSVTVPIVPGAADFADAAGEQAGEVTIPVVPNVAEFAEALNEETAALVVSVPVVPDTTDFEAAVDEQVGDIAVPVGLRVDASSLADSLGELGSLTGLSGVPVQVTPDMSDFADAVAEGAAGISVAVAVTPDMGDFADATQEQASGVEITVPVTANASDLAASIEEQVGDAGITIPVSADTSGAVESLQDLQATEDAVAASAASDSETVSEGLAAVGDAADGLAGQMDTLRQLTEDSFGSVDYSAATAGLNGVAGAAGSAEAQFARLGTEFEAMSGQLDSMESSFGTVTAGMAGMSGDSAAVATQLDSLERAFAAVGEEVDAVGGQFSAAGADFQGTGAEISSLAGMITDLQGNLAATSGAVNEFIDGQENARQAVADLATAAGSVDYSAATEGLEGVAGAAGDVEKAAPAAADASSGLGSVLGMLGERLSYVAIDPFMWMYAAPMVIQGVTAAVEALSGASSGYIGMLTQQDQATSYNISGYKELAGQLSTTAAQYSESAASVGSSSVKISGDAADVFTAVSQEMTAASQTASTTADNLVGHLGTLASEYGLTQTQAEQLATAAGVQASQLDGSGAAAAAAMAKVQNYANANLDAQNPVSQLAQDTEQFGNDALTASTRVGALDNAYQILTGNFVSSQQSMLQVAGDFLTIESNAQQAGASMSGTNSASLQLQGSFYSIIPAIEQTANAMTKQGDSTSQVTAYVQAQIDKLTPFVGGNQQAAQAVQGLKQWEDNLKGSLDAADQATVTAAGHLQNNFITQLADAGDKSSTTKTAVDELTNSIIATGTQSNATKADRAQLIADLEQSGINAQTATALVDAYIKKIDAIPTSKTLTLTENASAQWTITGAAIQASQGGAGSGNAAGGLASGGLIQGGSRHLNADDIPALLSHGEYVVNADAVRSYGVGMMDSINAGHFADGGVVSQFAGLGAWTVNAYDTNNAAFTAAVQAAVQAALGQTPGNSKPPIIINFNGTQMPTTEQQQAMMMSLSAAVGVS